MRQHLFSTTLALALFTGCGDSLSPEGATASSTSGSGAGSTTGPGVGGALPASGDCSTIAFRPAVITLDEDPSHDDDAPQLVATGSAGLIALAFERRLAASTIPFTEVGHTAFNPFNVWPIAPPGTLATPSIPETLPRASSASRRTASRSRVRPRPRLACSRSPTRSRPPSISGSIPSRPRGTSSGSREPHPCLQRTTARPSWSLRRMPAATTSTSLSFPTPTMDRPCRVGRGPARFCRMGSTPTRPEPCPSATASSSPR
ncbi:Hypothetical protein A7982_03848 [Minicystis rosea]|nr:Hypothetical protein A7982_03848 [Minicystis rosea]